MKRLREKLHSQNGASILLALLLFLVCVMVSASILAASASNAGKARSNRAEQQKQLTLSSAIRLVAKELEKAEYRGAYVVYEWTEVITTTITDADGNSISTSERKDYFWCEQKAAQAGNAADPKQFICGDLTDLVPLQKELDEIFRRQFTARGAAANGYKPLSDAHVESPTPRVLTVTLPLKADGTTVDLEGYPDSGPAVYQVPNTVTVKVELNHDTHHITLTAWLGDSAAPPADFSSTMLAELAAREGSAPTLDYNPAGRTAGIAHWESGVVLQANQSRMIENQTTTQYSTNPATKWELSWLRKGVG